MTDRKMDREKKTAFGVGYIGYGEFSSRLDNKDTKAYTTWRNMLSRCYSDDNPRNRSYNDCTVCEEWHNFQNFALWFYQNHPDNGKKYHLDKDKIVKGNRMYSPENCCFISPSENAIISNQKKFLIKHKNGEELIIMNMSQFCLSRGLNKSAMSAIGKGKRRIHKGWIHVEEIHNNPELLEGEK